MLGLGENPPGSPAEGEFDREEGGVPDEAVEPAQARFSRAGAEGGCAHAPSLRAEPRNFPDADALALFQRSRKNASVAGQAFAVAFAFAPSRPVCWRRNPCPAPSYTFGA